MSRFFAAYFTSAFLLLSLLAWGDVSRETGPSDIELAPGNPLLEQAQALLDGQEATKDATRQITRLVEAYCKKGVAISEPKAWETLSDFPKRSMKVEMLLNGSVAVPESAVRRIVLDQGAGRLTLAHLLPAPTNCYQSSLIAKCLPSHYVVSPQRCRPGMMVAVPKTRRTAF